MDQGTPSLLFTLLEGLVLGPSQYAVDPIVQPKIAEVVEATQPRPSRRNLTKDVAQKKLYGVLYEIIEKEYEESHEDPGSTAAQRQARVAAQQQNQTFTKAIGLALEMAIRDASIKGEPPSNPLIALRDELRTKIVEALTPK
jgi:hypothetical protein